MEFAFSSPEDWSSIFYPHINTMFKETNLCYFGHVIYDESNNFSWMMTNSEWAQTYWLGKLYLDEPIYQDIQKLTLKNHTCIALWDCYNTSNNDYQQEIMQRRMDICGMKKGITIGKLIDNKMHYMSVGWKDVKSCDTTSCTTTLLKEYIHPIWLLHTELVEKQRKQRNLLKDSNIVKRF